MKYILMIFVAVTFAACGDRGAPTAADIEEGYRNLADKNYALALKDYGSEDAIPPILVGMIRTTARIELTSCEKAEGDIGYICLYNLTPINAGNVVLDEIVDVKARVYKGDVGWLVDEIEE